MNLNTIKGKIIAISLIIATILIFQAAFMINKIFKLEHSISEVGTVQSEMVKKSYALQIAVIQVQQWLTDISATRALDGLNDGFDEAEANAKLVRSLVGELSELDTKHPELYQDLLPTFEQYYSVGKQMAQSYIDEGPSGGNKMMASFDQAAASITKAVTELMTTTINESDMTLEIQKEQIKSTSFWTIVFSAVYLITLFAYVYLQLNLILKRLSKVAVASKQLAEGEGDLTKLIEIKRQDEISDISHAINSLMEKLRGTIESVNNGSSEISEAVSELEVVSNKTNSAIQQQHTNTQNVTTAMDHLMASTEEVTNNILKTSDSTQAVSSEVREGEQVLNRSVSSITHLADDVRQASTVVDSLTEDSQNIGSVLDVIKGIAEQTNLLALNAAIEAARAGEQGRGFAVVADEVRTLASRTQESAEEINNMITRLQTRVSEIANVMGSSLEKADQSVSDGQLAKQSLIKILGSIDDINEKTQIIANTSKDQIEATESLGKGINCIADATQQNTDNSNNVVKAGKKILHASENLHEHIKSFKFIW